MVATSLASVTEQVLNTFVAAGSLETASLPSALRLLSGARKPKDHTVHGASSLKRGSLLVHGALARVPGHHSAHNGGSSTHGETAEDRENHKLLQPDEGEEALDLILAHVDFIRQTTVAFVRLQKPIDAGARRAARINPWRTRRRRRASLALPCSRCGI